MNEEIPTEDAQEIFSRVQLVEELQGNEDKCIPG